MTIDSIRQLPVPQGFSPDPLTDILRSGARDLIAQAVEAELTSLLLVHADERTEDGRARIVRHGHLPEREVMTGIGPVPVKVPRVRDRGDSAEKVRFTSSILPPYLRKAKPVEDLLPWLYLKGLSTGDFQEALAALLGPSAAGLSSSLGRLNYLLRAFSQMLRKPQKRVSPAQLHSCRVPPRSTRFRNDLQRGCASF